jgi:hypothetical protein
MTPAAGSFRERARAVPSGFGNVATASPGEARQRAALAYYAHLRQAAADLDWWALTEMELAAALNARSLATYRGAPFTGSSASSVRVKLLGKRPEHCRRPARPRCAARDQALIEAVGRAGLDLMSAKPKKLIYALSKRGFITSYDDLYRVRKRLAADKGKPPQASPRRLCSS